MQKHKLLNANCNSLDYLLVGRIGDDRSPIGFLIFAMNSKMRSANAQQNALGVCKSGIWQTAVEKPIDMGFNAVMDDDEIQLHDRYYDVVQKFISSLQETIAATTMNDSTTTCIDPWSTIGNALFNTMDSEMCDYPETTTR